MLLSKLNSRIHFAEFIYHLSPITSTFTFRVLTGMVLGLLFNKSSSSMGMSSVGDDHASSAIGKGLLQGSALCGIVLVSTAVWLAGSGLSKPVAREKQEQIVQQEKSKTD